ncbi:nucleoredoxin [Tribolium castaneum]|uniref:Nucleoredoxin-like Protein n=1 Tax=Tribolium castaneum TaxID=7070 RepID=D2A4C5_TRICA|nr:PREDICTED: nucleoredoxin [Tribolium castaneum]EFA04807.1 Nucleoredoxin-like Protein [Tribolium castaneum]|eukprot:XP_972533.1 PREDICTED: nucleoredoxin [Tribolium castaneum]
MDHKSQWHERLFGQQLLKCDTNSPKSGDFLCVATPEVLQNVQITGVYFSFANISQQSDEFTKKLKVLYERLNQENCEVKKFEVVQVVLWANNDVFSDFENSHRDSLVGLPWFAVPFSEIDLKTRLSRRYRIKSGVPTLVLLDRDGGTISVSAQDRLLEDPLGSSFPWRPRPVDQVLKDVVLQKGGTFSKEHPCTKPEFRYSDLPDAVRGFYFSANWCPPCRAFTPQLAEVYRLIRKKEPGFEIVFVSSDRSAESFEAYVEGMPWLVVPWQQAGVRAELAQLYGIRGIPTLLLLDRNGHIITMDARTELAEDPMAQNFPWKPRAVNILTERFANKLHDYPAIVLFVDGEETELQFAESVLSPAADSYYKKHNINFNSAPEDFFSNCEDDHYLQFLIGLDSETSDILRDLIGLDDVVPLLVGIDIPNRRFAVMEYGVEITVDSVSDFVERFQKGEVKFIELNERVGEEQS